MFLLLYFKFLNAAEIHGKIPVHFLTWTVFIFLCCGIYVPESTFSKICSTSQCLDLVSFPTLAGYLEHLRKKSAANHVISSRQERKNIPVGWIFLIQVRNATCCLQWKHGGFWCLVF